jgi:hypothetical protein
VRSGLYLLRDLVQVALPKSCQVLVAPMMAQSQDWAASNN